jgi:hypothetical protein
MELTRWIRGIPVRPLEMWRRFVKRVEQRDRGPRGVPGDRLPGRPDGRLPDPEGDQQHDPARGRRVGRVRRDRNARRGPTLHAIGSAIAGPLKLIISDTGSGTGGPFPGIRVVGHPRALDYGASDYYPAYLVEISDRRIDCSLAALSTRYNFRLSAGADPLVVQIVKCLGLNLGPYRDALFSR